MPSAGGARLVGSGKEEEADVNESVRVDISDDSVTGGIILLIALLHRMHTLCVLHSRFEYSTAIFRVPRAGLIKPSAS